MKIFKLIPLILLAACVRVESPAQPIYAPKLSYSIGQDTLAIESPYFNVQNAIRLLPQGAPLGALHNTFSASLANLDAAIAGLHPTAVRIHLINGPGIRNGQSGPYEIGKGYSKASFSAALEHSDPKIIKYIKGSTALYKALSEKYPATQFLISPELEHDLSIRAWHVSADAVASVWPSVTLVNSPDGGIPIDHYRNALVERHGSNPQSDASITSLDGAEATDSNISGFLARSPNARIKFIWDRSYNCRHDSGAFEDPRARKGCPKPQDFEQLAHIYDTPEAPSSFQAPQCTKLVQFKAPWIWKPKSEDSGQGDSRANKPVAITGYSGNLDVITYNGKLVGTLGYYGAYTPLKLQRAYSGWRGGSSLYGYEFEKGAQALSGYRQTYIQSGHQCAGPILTGRRNGSYR
jgi:hypothetical protein